MIPLSITENSRRFPASCSTVCISASFLTMNLTINLIRSMAASTIMRVTYGIEVQERNDIYISAAERAVDTMSVAGLPGAFIVDSLPIRTDQSTF